MAAIPVKAYALVWSVATNKGAVDLQLATGAQGQIPVDSPGELAALADILRSSHEVGFDGNGQVLSTAFKSPGTA